MYVEQQKTMKLEQPTPTHKLRNAGIQRLQSARQDTRCPHKIVRPSEICGDRKKKNLKIHLFS